MSQELPAPPEPLARRLDELVQGLLSRKHVRHAILAVERGGGLADLADGAPAAGYRWIGTAGPAGPSGVPMRAETPFFVASVTKLYTAAAVLKLHEQRALDLDEPISAHLPPSLVDGLHRTDGVDRSGEITVRHLLGHTSGLPDYLEEGPEGGRSLVQRLIEEGDRSWSIEEAIAIVRDRLTPHFPPQRLDARPRARYSDTNYVLLIAIVEAVTARSQGEAFEELLLRPLGLRHTWLPGGSPLDPTPDPATLWFRDMAFDRPLAMRSSRDLYATADDLLAFIRALVGGRVFEDRATLELMRGRWIRFGFPRDRAALRIPGWPIEYGLGAMRFTFTLPRIRTPAGRQPTLFGHSGSTGSWLFHCPELDLSIAGTVDQGTAGAAPFRFAPKLLGVLARASG